MFSTYAGDLSQAHEKVYSLDHFSSNNIVGLFRSGSYRLVWATVKSKLEKTPHVSKFKNKTPKVLRKGS